MVTLPELVFDSALKGSNLAASDFSASALSGFFISGASTGAPAAGQDTAANASAARHCPHLRATMIDFTNPSMTYDYGPKAATLYGRSTAFSSISSGCGCQRQRRANLLTEGAAEAGAGWLYISPGRAIGVKG